MLPLDTTNLITYQPMGQKFIYYRDFTRYFAKTNPLPPNLIYKIALVGNKQKFMSPLEHIILQSSILRPEGV